jgi:signal transduction histidine kinase
MATNLSHELKTPLAAIRGSAELLEGPASNDAAARAKFLANIQSEVARLDRIVSELLKLSRIEAQPPGTEIPPIDAGPAAKEVAEMYQRRAADLGLKFHAELAETALPIRIAEMQLKQLLTNLLDNAMQFTAAGHDIRFTSRRKENVVEFEIRDNGAGIEPELLPKIFDRFFTTANPRTGDRGTGLGLAIAKSIANASGGTISVESELGRGSTFTVTFPAA